jgi:Ca2+-binding EF-hand superfamily protein
MTAHDEKLKRKTFEDFVKEADTNQDGLVSIDECAEWITRNLQIVSNSY